MNIPDNLKYTKEHEWIKIDGNIGTIGITDYAQSELGDIVFIDISGDLSEITSGESFGTIEAVKTVSDLYAPCNGKIKEINSKIIDEPQVINSDPYGDGWLIKVEITNMADLKDLMDATAYKAQIGE
ncbi:MAG: glycine cleavage system protein H [Ignavibacteria bacterium RBG_13_36_8]|nr:MAG: glycine cleavage system protein H [Ignavibacteria bacterium RBG_13_36_8]